MIDTATLEEVAHWATIIGAPLAACAILYTARQIRLAKCQAKASFMLNVYQMMDQHNQLHRWMMDDSWPSGPAGPDSNDEWLAVGRLLGLYEHLGCLVRDGLLGAEDVTNLYGYRLIRVLRNRQIYERHFAQRVKEDWPNLNYLLQVIRGKRQFRELKRSLDEAIQRQSS